MPVQLTDEEIGRLIAERKALPENYQAMLVTRPKRGHRERDIGVLGSGGNEFLLVFRESSLSPFDFSVILMYRPANSTQLFRLRRYNGRSHEHTNVLERQKLYDFHIHTATERYQASGLREDTYAERADRFSDFRGAVDCMFRDCNFDLPETAQRPLF